MNFPRVSVARWLLCCLSTNMISWINKLFSSLFPAALCSLKLLASGSSLNIGWPSLFLACRKFSVWVSMIRLSPAVLYRLCEQENKQILQLERDGNRLNHRVGKGQDGNCRPPLQFRRDDYVAINKVLQVTMARKQSLKLNDKCLRVNAAKQRLQRGFRR